MIRGKEASVLRRRRLPSRTGFDFRYDAFGGCAESDRMPGRITNISGALMRQGSAFYHVFQNPKVPRVSVVVVFVPASLSCVICRHAGWRGWWGRRLSERITDFGGNPLQSALQITKVSTRGNTRRCLPLFDETDGPGPGA